MAFRGAGRFERGEKRLLSALAPHLQREVALNFRLSRIEMQREGAAEMPNRCDHGAILVDPRPVYCSLWGHRWSPASTRAEEPPRKDGPPQFCLCNKPNSLSSNPNELVAIRVTKISEISAIWAHARRILD